MCVKKAGTGVYDLNGDLDRVIYWMASRPAFWDNPNLGYSTGEISFAFWRTKKTRDHYVERELTARAHLRPTRLLVGQFTLRDLITATGEEVPLSSRALPSTSASAPTFARGTLS